MSYVKSFGDWLNESSSFDEYKGPFTKERGYKEMTIDGWTIVSSDFSAWSVPDTDELRTHVFSEIPKDWGRKILMYSDHNLDYAFGSDGELVNQDSPDFNFDKDVAQGYIPEKGDRPALVQYVSDKHSDPVIAKFFKLPPGSTSKLPTYE
jgi:hypothetical protein